MKTNLGFLMAVLLTGCTTTVIDMPKGDGGTTDTGTDPDGAAPDGSPAACSAKNCAGCCYNGVCEAGTAAGFCGKSGVTCAFCPTLGIGSVCRTDQTCGLDPEGTWKVQPINAKIATTNQGADWDFGGGAPDPYVTLNCPSTMSVPTNRTPTVMDTFTPTWSTGGCVMKAKDLLSLGYGIQVWDEDVSVNDAVCGKGTITVKESDLFSGVQVVTALPNLIYLNLAFEIQ